MDKTRTQESLAATIAGIMILSYQMLLRGLLPRACRFSVSCSDFTLMAVRCYGARAGLLMGFKRLLKCHPFSSAH